MVELVKFATVDDNQSINQSISQSLTMQLTIVVVDWRVSGVGRGMGVLDGWRSSKGKGQFGG